MGCGRGLGNGRGLNLLCHTVGCVQRRRGLKEGGVALRLWAWLAGQWAELMFLIPHMIGSAHLGAGPK